MARQADQEPDPPVMLVLARRLSPEQRARMFDAYRRRGFEDPNGETEGAPEDAGDDGEPARYGAPVQAAIWRAEGLACAAASAVRDGVLARTSVLVGRMDAVAIAVAKQDVAAIHRAAALLERYLRQGGPDLDPGGPGGGVANQAAVGANRP